MISTSDLALYLCLIWHKYYSTLVTCSYRSFPLFFSFHIRLMKAGRVEDAEMARTFNMGIGMVLVVSQDAALRLLGDAHGTNIAYRIGEVVKGDGVSYQ